MGHFKKARINIRELRGLFPVYKERGDHVEDLLDWIKLTLEFEARIRLKGLNIKLDCFPRLEPTSRGIVSPNVEHLSLIKHGVGSYQVEASLGKATHLFNSEGHVTEEKPFHHVTEDQMRDCLNALTGDYPQVSAPRIVRKQRILNEAKKALQQQGPVTGQYYEGRSPRLVTCIRMDLSDFKPPQFSLSVQCVDNFCIRAMVNELGQRVNSCAHVVELEKQTQGPFTAADCLRKHQLYYNEIVGSIKKHQNKYWDWVSTFSDKKRKDRFRNPW